MAMSDRPEVTAEILVEHWRRQVQKLSEAGIPLERISNSIRTAALEVEQAWFRSLLDRAGERLAAMGPPPPAKAAAGLSSGAEGVTVVKDRIVIEVEGKAYDGTYEVTGRNLTVRSAHGSQSTPVVVGTPPEVLAKMLLGELVREEKARPDPPI